MEQIIIDQSIEEITVEVINDVENITIHINESGESIESTRLIFLPVTQDFIDGNTDTFVFDGVIDPEIDYYAINGGFINTKWDGIASVTVSETQTTIVFSEPVPDGNVLVIAYQGSVEVLANVNPSPPDSGITCDSTFITCDSSQTVTVNGVQSTIREQFDSINEKFTVLYTNI